jgi:hypothetical protein
MECHEFMVELTAKECFGVFFGDEENNFYRHFKETYIEAKELKFTKYDREVPAYYRDEVETDISSILQSTAIRREFSFLNPIKERVH